MTGASVPDDILHPEQDCLGGRHRLVPHHGRPVLGFRVDAVERREGVTAWEGLALKGTDLIRTGALRGADNNPKSGQYRTRHGGKIILLK